MDKVSKLKMSHNSIDAQDIRVVVKTGASSSTLIPTSVHSPISVVETLAHIPEVDLVNIVSILIVEEPTVPPI